MLELNWKGRKYFCAGELVEVATSLDALTAVWYFAGKYEFSIRFNSASSVEILSNISPENTAGLTIWSFKTAINIFVWNIRGYIHFSFLKHKHKGCTLKMFRTEAASNPAFWTLASASTTIWGGGISTEYILCIQAIQASTSATSFCILIKYSI